MKKNLIIFLILNGLNIVAQCDTCKYDRKEEIIDNGKRYVIHNNYLMVGAGYASSSLHKGEQAGIGIDFMFHIRRVHFMAGVLMSGDQFLNNNNLSGHFGYYYRIEDEKKNIVFGGGISQNKGKVSSYISNHGDTVPDFYYRNTGVYLSVAYFRKITYDIGIGGELFADLNRSHQMIGVKAVLFFSGAYRGKAKIFNRHVKSQKK